MNKFPLLIGVLLIAVVLVSGCTTSEKIACDKPYILVGNDCCLDKDDNNICDKDESYVSQRPVQGFTVEECSFPDSGLFTCQSNSISDNLVKLNLHSSTSGPIIIKKITLPAVSCEAEFSYNELNLNFGTLEPGLATLFEDNKTTYMNKNITLISWSKSGEITLDVNGIRETFSGTKVINGIKVTLSSLIINRPHPPLAILVFSDPDASEMRFGETRQFNIPCDIKKSVIESNIVVDFIYYQQNIIDSGGLFNGTYYAPKHLTSNGWISAIVR